MTHESGWWTGHDGSSPARPEQHDLRRSPQARAFQGRDDVVAFRGADEPKTWLGRLLDLDDAPVGRDADLVQACSEVLSAGSVVVLVPLGYLVDDNDGEPIDRRRPRPRSAGHRLRIALTFVVLDLEVVPRLASCAWAASRPSPQLHPLSSAGRALQPQPPVIDG